ncbi:tetratricopeptide repeat protein [bacterium]|nr:tetratricopeptide repeat protein [bacterium]
MKLILKSIMILVLSSVALAKDVRVPQDIKDLGEAIEKSSMGDTIHVGAGYVYLKGIVLKKNITIAGDANKKLVINNPTGPGILVCDEAGTVSLSGIIVNRCMDDAIRVSKSKKPTSLSLCDMNIFENYGIGISVLNDISLNIVGCTFAKNRGEGVRINGMYMNSISNDIHLENCSFSEHKTDAMVVQNSRQSHIEAKNISFSKNRTGVLVRISQGYSSTTLNMNKCTFTSNVNGVYINGNRNALQGSTSYPSVISACTFDGSTSSALKLEENQGIHWKIKDTIIHHNSVGVELNRLNCPGLIVENCSIRNNTIGLSSIAGSGKPIEVSLRKTTFTGNTSSDYFIRDPISIRLAESSPSQTQAYSIISEGVRMRIDGAANSINVISDPLLNRQYSMKIPFDKLEKLSGDHNSAFLLSYCRVSAQICNLLDEAEIWNNLGNMPKALGCTASAKKIFTWIVDRSPDPDFIKPLRNEILTREADLKKKSSSGAKKTSEYSRLASLQDQYSQISTLSQIAGLTMNISSDRDELIQIALNDMATRFSNGSSNVEEIGTFLKERLAKHYDNYDVAKMLKWMDANVESKKAIEPVPYGEKYHLFMADEYNRIHSYENEIRHLTKIVDSYSTGATTTFIVGVANRITDLYEKQLKQPENAIGIQKRLSRICQNTEYDYNARLRAAKILMDNQKYERAVMDLNSLIKTLPKEYQDIPVRTLLGLALIGASRYDDARNELSIVQNRDSRQYRERALYLIGYSYIRENKLEEAVRPFNDLANLYPSGQFTRQAKEYIRKLEKK